MTFQTRIVRTNTGSSSHRRPPPWRWWWYSWLLPPSGSQWPLRQFPVLLLWSPGLLFGPSRNWLGLWPRQPQWPHHLRDTILQPQRLWGPPVQPPDLTPGACHGDRVPGGHEVLLLQHGDRPRGLRRVVCEPGGGQGLGGARWGGEMASTVWGRGNREVFSGRMWITGIFSK